MKKVEAFFDDTFQPVRRTCPEYGLSDAQMAVAMHHYKQPLSKRFFYALIKWGWLTVPALLAASVLTGCDSAAAEADQQDADALSSREWAGQQVCGPEATAVWLDDKTIECLRNRHGVR